jgi:hypothetical protein
MRLTLAAAAATLLVAAALAGCSEDTPAVCTSVDNLSTAVDDLKNVDVTTSGGISDLQSALATVQNDFATVRTDAKSQFSSQLDAVDTALAALKTSIDAAIANPSASTLAAVGAAAPPAQTALQTLVSDVKSTC